MFEDAKVLLNRCQKGFIWSLFLKRMMMSHSSHQYTVASECFKFHPLAAILLTFRKCILTKISTNLASNVPIANASVRPKTITLTITWTSFLANTCVNSCGYGNNECRFRNTIIYIYIWLTYNEHFHKQELNTINVYLLGATEISKQSFNQTIAWCCQTESAHAMLDKLYNEYGRTMPQRVNSPKVRRL